MERAPIEILVELQRISEDLWWVQSDNVNLFGNKINQNLWNQINHNFYKFLKFLPVEEILSALKNKEIYDIAEEIIKEYNDYYSCKRWLEQKYPQYKNKIIAYLCMEFGLHESIWIYSGGLGVLAGDHIITASDLGIKTIGVGLLYKKGYVLQEIASTGEQKSLFPPFSFYDIPLKEVKNKNGKEIIFSLKIGDDLLYFKPLKLKVGLSELYLFTTDIKLNKAENRSITDKLYDSNRRTRLIQEMILGIGAVKLFKALGIEPDVWHLNEGHSAFLLIERARELMETKKLSFKQALKNVKKNVVFTTHTPVEPGHERFKLDLIKECFQNYLSEADIDYREFIETGIDPKGNEDEYNMTVLAINYSSYINGVSKLHQEVTKRMWKHLWSEKTLENIPVDYVTNGVHAYRWLGIKIKEKFKKYAEEWEYNIDKRDFIKNYDAIPDEELWEAHLYHKRELLEYLKKKIEIMYRRNGVEEGIIQEIISKISYEKLTIGFARRVAPYKRAYLIFSDLDRLINIVNNSDKPVQIIFAGKAHPADTEGQEIVKMIYENTLKKELRGRILFLENYSMNSGRLLVQGCDVWLNNPRRPYEASGTSGQKAGMNGVINCSILDGWWAEGYNKENGWAFGTTDDSLTPEQQDKIDAEELYNVLEKEIIPLYYSRNENGIPEKWIKKMKESIKSVLVNYNTERMLKEYFEKFYKNLF